MKEDDFDFQSFVARQEAIRHKYGKSIRISGDYWKKKKMKWNPRLKEKTFKQIAVIAGQTIGTGTGGEE